MSLLVSSLLLVTIPGGEAPSRGVGADQLALRPISLSTGPADFEQIEGLWRLADDPSCDGVGEYQYFSMTSDGFQVEVGAGNPGAGIRLPIIALSVSDQGVVSLQTRVCGPPGCSRTEEEWHLSARGELKEWSFVGRDGDRPPYIQMQNGEYMDGSPGRTFVRCNSGPPTRPSAEVQTPVLFEE
jgi:hypothetical protein